MSDPHYVHDDEYYDQTRPMRRRSRAVRDGRSGRTTTVRVMTTVITILSGLFAVVLALHILFELLQANPANALVVFVDGLAKGLDLFFHDLFTPDYRWLRILLNYGLAALFWLAIGRVLVMIVRSFR